MSDRGLNYLGQPYPMFPSEAIDSLTQEEHEALETWCWQCTVCGDTTYTSYAGGEIVCGCEMGETTHVATPEEVKARAEQIRVFTLLGGKVTEKGRLSDFCPPAARS